MVMTRSDPILMKYSEWEIAEKHHSDDPEYDGDCPACLYGFLDEIFEVNKEGNEFPTLVCRECGYNE